MIQKDQQFNYSYVNLTIQKVMLSIKYKETYCKQPVFKQRMANYQATFRAQAPFTNQQ